MVNIDYWMDIGRQYVSGGRDITNVRVKYKVDGKEIFGCKGWKEANTAEQAKHLTNRYKIALEEAASELTIAHMECGMSRLHEEYRTRNAEAKADGKAEPYNMRVVAERIAKLPAMSGWRPAAHQPKSHAMEARA